MTQYTARIAPLASVIRIYIGTGDDPDPFVFSITAQHSKRDKTKIVELVGLRQERCPCGATPPNPIRYRKALCNALREQFGVREMTWTRKECGDERTIRMDTTTYRLIRNKE